MSEKSGEHGEPPDRNAVGRWHLRSPCQHHAKQTSRIIKTIERDLLALNAAVEAASAVKAGTGFAIAASELRNPAMRAAR